MYARAQFSARNVCNNSIFCKKCLQELNYLQEMSAITLFSARNVCRNSIFCKKCLQELNFLQKCLQELNFLQKMSARAQFSARNVCKNLIFCKKCLQELNFLRKSPQELKTSFESSTINLIITNILWQWCGPNFSLQFVIQKISRVSSYTSAIWEFW